jgi:hypothetical protein
LNQRLTSKQVMKLQFVQTDSAPSPEEEPGFKEFLNSSAMSGGATVEELEFLARLRFGEKRPTPLYYYRELQSLRDSLHFREHLGATMHKRREVGEVEKHKQVESRKSAVRRWAKNKARSRKNGKPKIA